MEATRELKLKLTVEAPDPSKPSKAFQDIAAQANKLSEAAKDAQKHLQRMQGPAALAANTGGGGSISWTRPGFTGSPGGISWTRPGFTGAPGGIGTSVPTSIVQHIIQGRGDAIQGVNPPRAVSAVSAFDRPQAVVIVGPKPLPVAVVSGAMGAAGATGVAGGSTGTKFGQGSAKSNLGGDLLAGLTRAGGVVAGIAMAAHAFGTITEAAAKMNDPLATSADRMMMLARAVPVFGDSLAQVVGGITSAVGRLQDWEGSLARDREMQRHPLDMARQQFEGEASEKKDALRRRTRDAGDALGAREKFPSLAEEMAGKPGGGLGGALQRAAWENKDDRLKGAMEAVRDAERALAQSDAGLAGAKSDAATAAGRRARAEAEASAARRGREAADKAAGVGNNGFSASGAAAGLASGGLPGAFIGGFGGQGMREAVKGPERERQLQREEKALAAQQEAIRRQQEAEERLGQKSLEMLQKRYELEKKRIELQKTRMELLQEEYQRTQNATRAFGALDVVSQRGVLDDIKQFKKHGRDGLTDDSFRRLESMFPDIVGKQLDEKVKDSPQMKELLGLLGIRDAETIQKELKPLKEMKVEMKVEVNERQFLDASKKAADDLLARLVPLIEAMTKASNAMVENKFKQNRTP